MIRQTLLQGAARILWRSHHCHPAMNAVGRPFGLRQASSHLLLHLGPVPSWIRLPVPRVVPVPEDLTVKALGAWRLEVPANSVVKRELAAHFEVILEICAVIRL